MYTQKQLTGISPHSVLHTMCLALAAAAMLSTASALQAGEAGEFNVRDAHVWHEDGWFLDAQSDIRLSSGAQEALENGIPLVFELRVQLVKTHRWLWDKIEHERIQLRQLQYHALSRSYLVKDIESGRQGVYSSLEDALYAVGLIDSHQTLEARNRVVVLEVGVAPHPPLAGIVGPGLEVTVGERVDQSDLAGLLGRRHVVGERLGPDAGEIFEALELRVVAPIV